jgi:hypothetical protein
MHRIVFVALIAVALVAMMVLYTRKIRAREAVAFSLWRERLQKPDWSVYSRYLQRPVPESLMRVYQRLALYLVDQELELVDQHGKFVTLTEFYPIDETALAEQVSHQPVGEEVFPFGTCAGVDLFLRAGSERDDGVWTYLRQNHEFIELFESVDVFEQTVLKALAN